MEHNVFQNDGHETSDPNTISMFAHRIYASIYEFWCTEVKVSLFKCNILGQFPTIDLGHSNPS